MVAPSGCLPFISVNSVGFTTHGYEKFSPSDCIWCFLRELLVILLQKD